MPGCLLLPASRVSESPRQPPARRGSMACSILTRMAQTDNFCITARSWSGPPGRTGRLIPTYAGESGRQQRQRPELAMKMQCTSVECRVSRCAWQTRTSPLSARHPSRVTRHTAPRLHPHRVAGGDFHPRHPGGVDRAGAQKFRQIGRHPRRLAPVARRRRPRPATGHQPAHDGLYGFCPDEFLERQLRNMAKHVGGTA